MQIINIPNSMTVLPELLPYSIEMVRHAPPVIEAPFHLSCIRSDITEYCFTVPRVFKYVITVTQ